MFREPSSPPVTPTRQDVLLCSVREFVDELMGTHTTPLDASLTDESVQYLRHRVMIQTLADLMDCIRDEFNGGFDDAVGFPEILGGADELIHAYLNTSATEAPTFDTARCGRALDFFAQIFAHFDESNAAVLSCLLAGRFLMAPDDPTVALEVLRAGAEALNDAGHPSGALLLCRQARALVTHQVRLHHALRLLKAGNNLFELGHTAESLDQLDHAAGLCLEEGPEANAFRERVEALRSAVMNDPDVAAASNTIPQMFGELATRLSR